MKISASSFLLASATALLFSLPATAAEDKKAKAAAPAAPASDTVYSPTDLEKLNTIRDSNATVIVEGVVTGQGANKEDSVRYLNFSRNWKESVALVFFVKKGGTAFSVEKLAGYVGKKVRATGKLTEYASNLQIEIEKMDQLKIVE